MIMDIWPNGIQPESLSLNDILDCGMIQHAYYKNYTLNTQLVFENMYLPDYIWQNDLWLHSMLLTKNLCL